MHKTERKVLYCQYGTNEHIHTICAQKKNICKGGYLKYNMNKQNAVPTF